MSNQPATAIAAQASHVTTQSRAQMVEAYLTRLLSSDGEGGFMDDHNLSLSQIIEDILELGIDQVDHVLEMINDHLSANGADEFYEIQVHGAACPMTPQ